MINLVLNLIDRLIVLVKRREEVERNLFKDFIEPAFGSFEKVHENYLNTFSEYRVLVGNSEVPLDERHPLLQRIENDSLFSANLRSKLSALRNLESDPLLGAFMAAISVYLNYSNDGSLNAALGYPGPPEEIFLFWKNIARFAYRNGLIQIMRKNISEDQKKKEATRVLDHIVLDLQKCYWAVVKEYEKLKIKLLRPA